jgi:23S rRNA (guanosine2251-2'-O)-methyltransferase
MRYSNHMRHIVLIAHNLRSCHNVGSLLRTAEGLGATEVILSGYTPYPAVPNDIRLPHITAKITRQIEKTALGAEKTQTWSHYHTALEPITALQKEGYTIAAIEQHPGSEALPEYIPGDKVALIVGREVEGIEPEVLALCDDILEIPMFGRKESYNVVQAAAMALYHCRFAG